MIKKYSSLKIFGATEETTAGVNRIRAVEKQGKLRYPVISVNDAYTKHMFDNKYGNWAEYNRRLFASHELVTCI